MKKKKEVYTVLNFIGLGSAFNTKLGNTSACIKKGSSLLLIDCGGLVFHRINELKLLNKVKNLYIIITHTHPDHVGSLGEVIFYCHYILKIKPSLYYPNEEIIKTFLTCIGVEGHMVDIEFNQIIVFKDKHIGEVKLSFIPVSHKHTVKSFAFILNINKKYNIYYSGDANDIPANIVNHLKDDQLDCLYQDTSGIEEGGQQAHLSLNQLSTIIPLEYRHKVYCIHLDNQLNIKKVLKKGFSIPPIITRNKMNKHIDS